MQDQTPQPEIKALFLDIGGVLLSNGWEHQSRYMATKKFGLKRKEIEARHKLVFETYELGKITHDEYLQKTKTLIKTFLFQRGAISKRQ